VVDFPRAIDSHTYTWPTTPYFLLVPFTVSC